MPITLLIYQYIQLIESFRASPEIDQFDKFSQLIELITISVNDLIFLIKSVNWVIESLSDRSRAKPPAMATLKCGHYRTKQWTASAITKVWTWRASFRARAIRSPTSRALQTWESHRGGVRPNRLFCQWQWKGVNWATYGCLAGSNHC